MSHKLYSRFPIPDSRFPTPYSIKPRTLSLSDLKTPIIKKTCGKRNFKFNSRPNSAIS
ncbi:hypothetical protein [Moorena sp. SIO3H5]|uniref:hypothetical protein n=1 Tax=Moorena sp. SIO3H5 TaxID=2607834 RepID=UPI0025EB3F65|nr:hypothetical protein [Moorena sp. SIO3H5]